MHNNPPAFPRTAAACAHCAAVAVMLQGHQLLCVKHYRFGQMRATAKRRGLLVPSLNDLEQALQSLSAMQCPYCAVTMNWRGADGQASVVTLQHYRSGAIGFLCRSCNTRHAFFEGDDFMTIPQDHKRCPDCRLILPLTEFCIDRSGRFMDRKTYCRQCSANRHKAWRDR